ncbi:MAG: Methylmalonyl-CoA carboxyltransferase [Dehalococcoidia bacterium]|nr:Methylmalonyl-CoA carboxyltransferase [Dehalococcoidia bacterium]
MGMKEEVEKLKEQEAKARAGESPQAIEKQHKEGKLTARERLAKFYDEGTFVELNAFAQHQCHDFGMDKRRPYGDGVVTGYGKVNGRTVYAYAQDFTVLGGTVGHTHAMKIVNLMRIAQEAHAPVVGLVDSGGARIQEGTGTYSLIFAENIDASGVVPQISVIMGNCAGGGVYSPALTDFIFMVEGTSQMFITGPEVIKQVTGEEITMQDLGGARPQSRISGVCDFVVRSDEDCLEQVKRLLSFLPSSYKDAPPVVKTADAFDRSEESLLEIVPDDPRQVFDMRQIIKKVLDNGDFLEAKANFAKNIVTGFGRLEGHTVGIIANQPMVAAGCLDCDASDKAARFYQTCDCFNIPIITLVDVPGYMPGSKEEHKGIIRHGAKMLYTYREATVPKIACIIRKAYGGAQVAMGVKAMGADLILGWPTAEVAVMGAEGATNILYRKDIAEAADKEATKGRLIEEYRSTFNTPYYAASRQLIDIIIDPRQTRPQLIKALELLRNKREERPKKKHGNIPL